ncbi:MAG: non-canonical purine NTP pyrophosphatase, RdgB/HAM1 family [Candidatus Sungbacteria bacterium RIFCSPHIGHO2_01_FULL_51_22]|uniref:dITP/XTP pyrophosphatase n=1 Tax=Candidatus Sungbacteria bacterium RIFCSPHIGHO2_02_FULL_51_29 TaxID=1802273 RepID=A0A1G2KP35_9BACT|nr:MAG: non-canonical purine NTP pyrophosphatase, RdgB/HAM1 family [Candidatus Sungbacteria bacterium RIFCSPHIGHO2_01_FULL_51_22]OHA01177.1 MAG: non-canonical purine NTP pyrophosphatase, RdgB/HAM1 family [Candidatus Sungbacteria bacterium RIFCSPHIGHO2_02_FULL_51_29]OHA08039.1 MAG: non-canonical purine NTP pyrophosphatase, RdgB/HAM1 family [Candidatus Sungbacteria bacterium RIFCSPLOWO2_01_FULL_51_34]
MKKILLASRNTDKIQEVVAMLKGTDFELVTLDAFPDVPDVGEPALTFEGNAIIKAMIVGRKTEMLTIADDSGIEVDALGGHPGVFSARYASGTNEDRCRKLLKEIANVPEGERGAQFHAVIALFDPVSEKIRTYEGIQRGRLLREFRGGNGFGYDPIFFSDEMGKTNAEMTQEEKNAVSHRGKALRKALEILRELYPV